MASVQCGHIQLSNRVLSVYALLGKNVYKYKLGKHVFALSLAKNEQKKPGCLSLYQVRFLKDIDVPSATATFWKLELL
jgi:hypothetical protein